MSQFTRALTAAALAGLVGLAACADTDAVVAPAPAPGGDLFARYVALGNSITAGYQSGGINDSTQRLSYPVFLAQQAGVGEGFGIPLLRGACPSPLVAPFSTQRAAVRLPTANPALPCDRMAPGPRFVQNLAVPGAVLASALNINAAANPLTTYILGGRTPAEAMVEMQPSLVSVWLGNNDALGAALQGNTALLTAEAAFQTALGGLEAQILASGAQDAILIGPVDPVLIPALQPGIFAWLIKQNPQTAPLLPNPVNNNCAPVGPTGQPNPLAWNRVSLGIVGQTVPTTTQLLEISCADDAPFVLNPAEQQLVSERVAAFNALIRARAEANGWIYVNPNDNQLLGQFLNDPAALRRCQGLPNAIASGVPTLIQQAVATTCPSPDPAVGFGTLISFDGVHPSTRAHRIVANRLVTLINQKHTLNLPAITVN